MSDKLMMARKYEPEKHDPTGMLMFEKYDGVRAKYDDSGKFISRNNKEFVAPDNIIDKMYGVNFGLDGELWEGRGMFDQTSGKIRRKRKVDWSGVKFMVFDLKDYGYNDIPYRERLKILKKMHRGLGKYAKEFIRIAPHELCKGKDHLEKHFSSMVSHGAEGLMLRNVDSLYESGKRSKNLLKVKAFHDCEVKVTGHQNGTGKYDGMCGALICDHKGSKIRVGSGLNDEQRLNPPPIGSIVTISYFEMNKATGKPRFPTFVAVRDYE